MCIGYVYVYVYAYVHVYVYVYACVSGIVGMAALEKYVSLNWIKLYHVRAWLKNLEACKKVYVVPDVSRSAARCNDCQFVCHPSKNYCCSNCENGLEKHSDDCDALYPEEVIPVGCDRFRVTRNGQGDKQAELSLLPNVLKELKKTSFAIFGEWTDETEWKDSQQGQDADPALAATEHLRTWDLFCSHYIIEKYQDPCGPASKICVKICFEGNLASYESATQASEVFRCIVKHTLWKWVLYKTREGAPRQAVPDEIKVPFDTFDQALALVQALKIGTRSTCKFKCFAMALSQTGSEDHHFEVPEM